MTGGAAQPGKKAARIEIIPLIDIIFFLLATFVLFTLSLSRIQSIPLDLPQAQPPRPDTPPDDDSVTLQVSDSGTIYWNKELIDMSELAPRLAHYVDSVAAPNRKVLIATDDRAKYGDTIEVLDLVRSAGINQVSIETVYRPTGR
jgi:biopolymer transport protein ExbD